MNYDPHAPNPDEQLSPEELAARKEADRKRQFARDWPIEMRKILGGEALKTEDAPLPNSKRCILTVGHKGKCLPVFPR